ncbi:MAG TPA: hypothetical protein VI685_05385 [Candidatus Angelobacter sp.]
MEPKPLTPAQKRNYILVLVAGIVTIGIGIAVSISDDSARFLPGGLLGGGGAMLAMGLIGLFHRPDR